MYQYVDIVLQFVSFIYATNIRTYMSQLSEDFTFNEDSVYKDVLCKDGKRREFNGIQVSREAFSNFSVSYPEDIVMQQEAIERVPSAFSESHPEYGMYELRLLTSMFTKRDIKNIFGVLSDRNIVSDDNYYRIPFMSVDTPSKIQSIDSSTMLSDRSFVNPKHNVGMVELIYPFSSEKEVLEEYAFYKVDTNTIIEIHSVDTVKIYDIPDEVVVNHLVENGYTEEIVSGEI